MKINFFEGFKRFNQLIISAIFIFGFIVCFNQSVSIDKTIHHKGKDYKTMGGELFGDEPQQKSKANTPTSKENNGYITDPELLKQLGDPSIAPKDSEYITDPELLEQLNSNTQPRESKSINTGKLVPDSDLPEDLREKHGFDLSKAKPVVPENECLDSYESTEHIGRGWVNYTFCFDQKYDYDSMKDFAQNYQISEAEKTELNKQLHDKWLQSLIPNIGYVFLAAFSYFIFCKVVKYIAIGFIKE